MHVRIKNIAEVCALVALGVVSRLIPHLPNMTPMGAIALRARARFGTIGLAIPIVSMLLSDALIGFYDLRILASVYISFLCVGLLGTLLHNRPSTARVAFIALIGSVLFFIITNTAVWAFSPWYEKSFVGLLTCYIVALPFFASTLLGDQFFSFLLFRYEKLAHYLIPVSHETITSV
jgi:hypothetical protein